MLTRNQEVVFGLSGQSIVFDALEGRPSSVTSVEVFSVGNGDLSPTEDALDPAVIEAAPVGVFTADSGASEPDRQILALDDTAALLPGRVYLAVGSKIREWIEIDAVNSPTEARSAAPLLNTFSIGDTFQTTRIVLPVKDAWAADTNNVSHGSPEPRYRVRLEYVVDGTSYVHAVFFNLVRYAESQSVTVAVMETFYPSWRYVLSTYHQTDQGARLIAQAYDDVAFDLRSSGYDVGQIRDQEVVDDLVKHKAVERLQVDLLMNGAGDTERVDLARRLYESRVEQLVTTISRVDIDTDGSGAGQRVTAQSIWGK